MGSPKWSMKEVADNWETRIDDDYTIKRYCSTCDLITVHRKMPIPGRIALSYKCVECEREEPPCVIHSHWQDRNFDHTGKW